MDKYAALFETLKRHGAGLVGAADLTHTAIPSDVRRNMPVGISIAVGLDKRIVDGVRTSGAPSMEYKNEYERANTVLSALSQLCTEEIRRMGHNAIVPVPPTLMGSQSLPRNGPGGSIGTELPHKTIASLSGLGWIGKSCLLVNENFGSAIRLVTILCDMAPPSPQTQVLASRVLKGTEWRGQETTSREDLLDVEACAAHCGSMREKFGHSICGLCMCNCPWTIKYCSSL
ncbi:epoxyqueuosine reductase [Pelomyxa schiedti]|nr:epoxyqueuosine reductase [Pelomyxa schiedti]